MVLLGKILEEEAEELKSEPRIPSIYAKDDKERSLKKAIALSTVLHPTFVGLAWLFVFIMTLLGITLPVFNKPHMKPKDIEFVLVSSKEAPPINKKTSLRADRNSQAGGKHDPTKRVAEPSPSAPKAVTQKSPAPQKQTAPQKQQAPKKQIAPQQPSAAPKAPVQKTQQQPAPVPTPKTPAPSAPVPSAARPTKTAPKPTVNPQSQIKIPFPKSPDYNEIGPASGGPVTSSKGTAKAGGGSGTGSSPSPVLSKSSGGSSGAPKGSGSSSGSSPSGGSYGNPSPGNLKGAPGIDAIAEPDFGPYMRELQRRIKMNWTPPKGNESKRVVLLFSISRDGRLLSVKVHKTSGMPVADNAAISAVQLTAPFKPLPPEYKGNSVDIQFTFDYNVFGASRY